MSCVLKGAPGRLRLKLPATSANLGPGFDAAAIALNFHLEIEAEPSSEFSIIATGRDAARCARVKNNLILDTYDRILRENDRPVTPLAIRMANGIPLGMGCGSSAAGRLAAIALAVHFGRLGWSPEQMLEEACVLEGHPDNAAACWLGGFVVAASRRKDRPCRAGRSSRSNGARSLFFRPLRLATSEARAMLPDTYSRSDAVINIQAASMLGLAFAQGARRSAAHRHERPYSPALSRFESALCCRPCCRLRGQPWHSGRCPQRRRALRYLSWLKETQALPRLRPRFAMRLLECASRSFRSAALNLRGQASRLRCVR